ncbi:MAG TPA: hypothetical protein VHD56_13485 [Tepidisphaeraceae bacterium]|nr:hypothetical protein [Tepidisphaeraceae bacterium]
MKNESKRVLNYSSPRQRLGEDARWGIVSIALSLTAPLALFLGNVWGINAALATWTIGFFVGCLGLWEKRRAKRLAITGLLMNIVVAVITAIVSYVYAMAQLGAGFAGAH